MQWDPSGNADLHSKTCLAWFMMSHITNSKHSIDSRHNRVYNMLRYSMLYLLAIVQVVFPRALVPVVSKILLKPDLQVEGCDMMASLFQ